jgi:hypothetical protein
VCVFVFFLSVEASAYTVPWDSPQQSLSQTLAYSCTYTIPLISLLCKYVVKTASLNKQRLISPTDESPIEACDIQGGSNMTGTNCDLFTHNQSRSYLNHLLSEVLNLNVMGNYVLRSTHEIYLTFEFLSRKLPCRSFHLVCHKVATEDSKVCGLGKNGKDRAAFHFLSTRTQPSVSNSNRTAGSTRRNPSI